jgi:hypothetical protein
VDTSSSFSAVTGGHDQADSSNQYDSEVVAWLNKGVKDAAHVKVCNAIRKLYAAGCASSSYSYKGGGEVFCGAHVIVDDGLLFYNWWKDVKGAKIRWSSHYDGGTVPPKKGTAAQYEIYFGKAIGEKKESLGALLFGKYQTSADGNTWTTHNKTWFQMEEYPAGGGAKETFGHVMGWAALKVFDENSGPWGNSKHIEKIKPVLVDPGDAQRIAKEFGLG